MSDNCCCSEEVYEVLTVGSNVPDFKIDTFNPATGEFGEFDYAKIRAEKKWLIVFFYPGDFTFVCSTELTALGEQYDRLKSMGAEVLAVSTDSKFVHLAWQRHEAGLKNVKYPMGGDRTGDIARLFGVYVDGQGYSRRGTFIVTPEGRINVVEIHDDPMGRNIDELMRRFKMSLLIAKHPEKACPSKWKDDGDPTLTPGAHMVGKVYGDGGALKEGQ